MINPKFLAVFLTLGIVTTAFHSGIAQVGQALPTNVESVGYQNIDVATFDMLRKDKSYTKIDVRSPDEVAKNGIGGLEIDYSGASFVSELEKLDKDGYYLVFCENGSNGAKAAQKMVSLGFKHVSNLQGGFASWDAADRPPE